MSVNIVETKIADLKLHIRQVVDGGSLTFEQAADALDTIMTGQATPAQVAALLTALRMRGETVDEIAGFASTMRRHALVTELGDDPRPVVDTCGTGGDGTGTFNISTTAAFAVSAAGVRVAKHGNRSMTSRCGSADVLEGLGVRIELRPEQVARCVNEVGIGFMFAPAFHPAMRHVGPVRREIGVRTLFNFLGPLTNPAGVRHQLIGVGDGRVSRNLADVLARLGSERALVVSSVDGMDEIGVSGESIVVEYDRGRGGVREYRVHPEDFGLKVAPRSDLLGGSVEENVAILRSVLAGDVGARRNATLINAGAALYAAGAAETIAEGIAAAADAIDSGRAAGRLDALIEMTQGMPS